MPQVEVSPTIKVKPENVPKYVKAICALTGEPEPPVGEVTDLQMRKLIRAIMNRAVKQYERETAVIGDPE